MGFYAPSNKTKTQKNAEKMRKNARKYGEEKKK
jgi:hypothetical protein